MGSFSIIAEISDAIVKLLQENLVPQILPNAENIGLASPAERGDTVLCINLYDVKESSDIVSTDMAPVGTAKQRFPSTFYELFFMITAFSASDIKFRSAEEARIMGRVLQVLKDNSALRPEQTGGTAQQYTPKIELMPLENEEKVKLWNVPNVPYKMSLFYKVYPVEIESERVRDVARVTDVSMQIRENKG
jgi:hypothetical protein